MRMLARMLVAVVLVGCAGSAPDPVSEALKGPAVTTYSAAVEILSATSPFEGELEALLGIDLESAERSIWEMRARAVATCAEARGVTLSKQRIQNIIPPGLDGDESVMSGSGIQEMIDNTESRESFGALPGEVQQVVDECQSETSAIADPLSEFRAWQDEVESDLFGRMSTSEAYGEAARKERECLEGSGVDEQARADIISRGQSIDQRWISGDLDRSSRDQQLQSLLEDELRINHVLDRCAAPRLATERALIARFEAEFLEQNSAALSDLGETIRAELNELGVVTGNG